MSKVAAGLLILALGLLALSFVNWQGRDMAATASAAAVVIPPTPTMIPAEYGRALFLTKGCTTCHRHDGLGVTRVAPSEMSGWTLTDASGAPNLTYYQPEPDFVRKWLRDPAAVKPGTAMPNLHLSEAQIEALLAFLATNEAAQ